MKIKIVLLIIFLSLFPIFSNTQQISFLQGSNIYIRIFLFFFPISNEYDPFFQTENNLLNIEMTIDKNNIKNEPATPSYFESNLVFYIKNIPYDKSGKAVLPLTIQCNKNFIKKDVDFIIYKKNNILILKGSLNDLYVDEITENEYFKNRYKWRFPIYFDIRLQLNDELIDGTSLNSIK